MLYFNLDVSRTYRNKEGYQAGGYKLNTSFRTETHTPDSFVELIRQGWPYTMVHHKRSPQETGAIARGVTTPKHTENFISRQELTADDDSQAPGVVAYWLNDDWFKRRGFAFVESVNSLPGEAEKGHPTILFDRPIFDPVICKAAAQALAWKYPRLDQGIHNVDRTIYNAEGARVHLLGNICEWDDFNREILQPYFAHLEEQKAREEAHRQRLQAERKEAPATGDRLESYARKSIQGILNRLATARDGERHRIGFWGGRALGSLAAADWLPSGLLDNIEDDFLRAAQVAGGYDDREILRTFRDGFKAGQTNPATAPDFYEPIRGGRTRTQEKPDRQPNPLPEFASLFFNHSTKAPELEKCEVAAEHHTWTAEGGRGSTFFYCNDPQRCALCRERLTIKLKFYLEEIARSAYVDENGNAAYAKPELNSEGDFITQQHGQGVWYATILDSKDKRRAFRARYRRAKPGGFISPEIYPVMDDEELRFVALSLAPFEDMEPVKLSDDLLSRITIGAKGAKASLLFGPPRDQLKSALPRYTFEIPQYLHDRGIVGTVKAPHTVLFTGPIKADDIYSSFPTKAETFDDIGLILEEIALKTIDGDRLRGEDDHAPDYVIQSIHIVPEAKPTYLKVYNAGREADQETLKRHKRPNLPKLPTLKSPRVDKVIVPNLYMALSTRFETKEPEIPSDYYARIEYLLQMEAI